MLEKDERPRAKITSKDVTRLFQFRSSLGTANDETILQVAAQFGISVDPTIDLSDLSNARKELFNTYYVTHFPTVKTPEEHSERLDGAVRDLVSTLEREKSKSSVWVFGSYARGVVNNISSDIDYVVILPKGASDDEIEKEYLIWEKVGTRNYVFSQELSPVENIIPLLETGRGLARLYGMTQDGLEAEFHILGIDDAKAMHKWLPGQVKRVQPVQAKMEVRMSHTGIRRTLPKNTESVAHYIQDDGVLFRGFFPESIAIGEIVFDQTGMGQEVEENVWQAVIKSFIFHNDAYEMHNGKPTGIRGDKIGFERFLNSLYQSNPDKYSPDRLKHLEEKYNKALSTLRSRYEIKLV